MKMLPVPGATGYFVDDQGHVWSDRRGGGSLRKLRCERTRNGYLRATIYMDDGTVARRSVHRLIAEVWHGPAPTARSICRHLDDDRSNNSPDNVAWGYHCDNVADAHRNGRYRRRIDEQVVRAIRTDVSAGMKYRDVVAKHGLRSTGHVSRIVNRTLWSHVT